MPSRTPRIPAALARRCGSLALLAPASLAFLIGCSGSTAKPAEDPPAPADSAAADSDVLSPPEPKPAAAPTPEPPVTESQRPPTRDNTIPDDYALTAGDCSALGKQYGAAMRNDQVVALSPKLTEAQRTQAEANIDKVVSTMAAQWADNCASALVGKIVDRKTVKCALDAKTVNEFKGCLGDEAPAGKK